MPNINPISPAGGTFAPQGLTPHLETVRQTNVHASDSITAAGAPSPSDWKPERPRLTPPSDLRLLSVTEESRLLGGEILDSLSIRLQCVKEKIRDVSAEMIHKLKEAAERASSSNFWSILKKIATCLISAVSAVFGISFLASGGSALIGGAMIASGVLSLANFALSEYGAWDWVADQISHDNEDTKKQIAMYLPMAVGVVAAGISIAGTVNGIATGAFQFAEQTTAVLQTIISLFGATTTLGKGIADGRLLQTQSEVKLLQAHETIQQEGFTTTIDEIKGSMNEFNAVKTKTKKAIEMITRSNEQLVRQI